MIYLEITNSTRFALTVPHLLCICKQPSEQVKAHTVFAFLCIRTFKEIALEKQTDENGI